jgi:hypothetical protein
VRNRLIARRYHHGHGDDRCWSPLRTDDARQNTTDHGVRRADRVELSYQAWLNYDDASNMFIALAQLKDRRRLLMTDTWAVVEENRIAVGLAPLTAPEAAPG